MAGLLAGRASILISMPKTLQQSAGLQQYRTLQNATRLGTADVMRLCIHGDVGYGMLHNEEDPSFGSPQTSQTDDA